MFISNLILSDTVQMGVLYFMIATTGFLSLLMMRFAISDQTLNVNRTSLFICGAVLSVFSIISAFAYYSGFGAF